jgi:hypothetical protein
MTAGNPPLADDFYRLGHDDYTGALRVDDDAMGIGLASALLGELGWSGSISLERGLVMVVRDAPTPADAVAHAVLDEIRGEPKLRDVATWLRYLAIDASDRVVRRMVAGNHLVPTEARRRLRRHVYFQPADPNRHAMARARLTTGLAHRRQVDPHDVHLLGIADATGLLSTIVDWGGPAAHDYYLQLIEAAHPDVQALVYETRTVIGSKVMGHR